eukprot:160023-Prorocentrum_lima.AAC.1
MALDAKNAFGTMSRGELAKVVQNFYPELTGLIPHLVVPAHTAYWMGKTGHKHPLTIAIGVHQGCPFSMGMFS